MNESLDSNNEKLEMFLENYSSCFPFSHLGEVYVRSLFPVSRSALMSRQVRP